jgi:hypothetical protein
MQANPLTPPQVGAQLRIFENSGAIVGYENAQKSVSPNQWEARDVEYISVSEEERSQPRGLQSVRLDAARRC